MKSRYSAYPYVIWMVIFTVVPLLLVAAFAITDSLIWFSLNSFFVLHWRFDVLFVQPFCNITHLLSRCISGKSLAQIWSNLFILYHVAFTVPADIQNGGIRFSGTSA